MVCPQAEPSSCDFPPQHGDAEPPREAPVAPGGGVPSRPETRPETRAALALPCTAPKQAGKDFPPQPPHAGEGTRGPGLCPETVRSNGGVPGLRLHLRGEHRPRDQGSGPSLDGQHLPGWHQGQVPLAGTGTGRGVGGSQSGTPGEQPPWGHGHTSYGPSESTGEGWGLGCSRRPQHHPKVQPARQRLQGYRPAPCAAGLPCGHSLHSSGP